MYLRNHRFTKIPPKNLIYFCPGRFCRLGTCDLIWLFSRGLFSGECIIYLAWITFQGRNLSNFFCAILENRWFHLYILTSSDLYEASFKDSPRGSSISAKHARVTCSQQRSIHKQFHDIFWWQIASHLLNKI